MDNPKYCSFIYNVNSLVYGLKEPINFVKIDKWEYSQILAGCQVIIIKLPLQELLNRNKVNRFIDTYIEQFTNSNIYLPTIIYTDYSLFDDIMQELGSDINNKSEVQQKSIFKQLKTVAQHKQELFKTINFFNNSSIWFRLCSLNNVTDINNACNDFYYFFKILKLYNNQNAKEYLEYHLRLQKANYLISNTTGSKSGGHGRHIAPVLYSNEQKLKTDIAIAPDLRFFYPDILENNEKPIRGIVLRILLIDDKISIEGKTTDECKAELIKKLLTLEIEHHKGEEKSNIFNKVCWRIQKGEIDSVLVKSFDKFELNKDSEDYTPKVIKDLCKDKIQIIAVKNLKTARQLLACQEIHFDLILMDYLLDKKKDTHGLEIDQREYATEFWGDGIEKYFEFSKDFDEKEYEEDRIMEYANLQLIYKKIKSYRGPMQRLWIFPITAFNQTFIDDLRNKGVRLIDYYWYLSRGADPINNPYLFIYTLNNFLQLQLKQAIFSMDMLFGFLNRSVEALGGIKDPEDFQAFMGAEYTVLIQKFGWRPVIYRDKEAGSLFAKYVWDNFYSRESNRILFRLLDLIQKFYQSCAYGEINDAKEMRNNLTEMKVYIMDEQENIRKILIYEYGRSVLNIDQNNAFMGKINMIQPR